MFSLLSAWASYWANGRFAGDFRHHDSHVTLHKYYTNDRTWNIICRHTHVGMISRRRGTYTSHSHRHRTNTSHPADTVPPGDHGLTPGESGLYRWYRRPFQEISKFQFHSTQNPLMFLYKLRWQGNFDISLRVCTSQMPYYEWILWCWKGC